MRSGPCKTAIVSRKLNNCNVDFKATFAAAKTGGLQCRSAGFRQIA